MRPAPSRPTSNRGPLIAGSLVVAAVAVGVIVFAVWKFGLMAGNELDVHKTEAAVTQILTNPTYGYGVENVSNVVCNNGKDPVAKKGATFTCVALVNGTKRTVAVLITDDNGTYEVDRPR